MYISFSNICVSAWWAWFDTLDLGHVWGSPVPSSQFHPGKFPMEDKAYNDIKKPGFCIKTRFLMQHFATTHETLGWEGQYCIAKSTESALVQLTYHFLLSAESPALGVKRAARDSVMYTFPGPSRFPSWLHSKYWNVHSWHVHVLLLSWWAKSKRSIGIESRMHWCQMFKAQNASSAGQNQQWPASTLLLNSPF